MVKPKTFMKRKMVVLLIYYVNCVPQKSAVFNKLLEKAMEPFFMDIGIYVKNEIVNR